MNIFKHFARHEDRIINGAPKEIGKTEDGKPVLFRIARAHESNPPFQRAVQSLLEAHKAELDALYQANKTDEEQDLRSKIVMDAFVGTCIKGWENVDGKDGQPLVYGEAALNEIAALPELTEQLFKFATTNANYVGTFDETTALKQ